MRNIYGAHFMRKNLCYSRPMQIFQFSYVRNMLILTLKVLKNKFYNIFVNTVNDLITVFIFKYMYNYTVYDLHLCCHLGDVHSHYTRNFNHNYFVFLVHTLCRKNFIVHTGIMLWNKIPSNIKLLGYHAFIGYVTNTFFSNYV